MLFYAENIEIHYLGLIDLDGHGAKKKEREKKHAGKATVWLVNSINRDRFLTKVYLKKILFPLTHLPSSLHIYTHNVYR
jgi:hypothetical protein